MESDNGDKPIRDERGWYLPGHASPGPGRPPGNKWREKFEEALTIFAETRDADPFVELLTLAFEGEPYGGQHGLVKTYGMLRNLYPYILSKLGIDPEKPVETRAIHQTNILQFLEQSGNNGEDIDKSIDARYKRAMRAAEQLRPNRNGDEQS